MISEKKYNEWTEAKPHVYKINFSQSILPPQIEDFPELDQLGNFTHSAHKVWLAETTIPEIETFSRCFVALMKKHHVPTENYTITLASVNAI